MASAAEEFFAGYIAEAQAAEASDEQIAVLREAAAKGELTRADVNGQLEYFAACMEDAGGVYFPSDDQVVGPDGYSVPGYGAGVPGLESGDALRVVEDCERIHIDFVLGALHEQPALIEARDAEYAEALPRIKECLSENGIVVDAEATASEVQALAIDLNFEAGLQCYTPSWWD